MILPSVTTVLGLYADFSGVPQAVLAHAADRGSRVHAYCAAIAQGLWLPEVDDDCAGYVQRFNLWFANVEDVLLVEQELVDPNHGYQGHPDLVVRLRGHERADLVDLKTPYAKNKLWAAQLSAYRPLVEDFLQIKLGRIYSLRLRQNGSWPKADEYHDDARHFAAFLSALNAWRWFTAA